MVELMLNLLTNMQWHILFIQKIRPNYWSWEFQMWLKSRKIGHIQWNFLYDYKKYWISLAHDTIFFNWNKRWKHCDKVIIWEKSLIGLTFQSLVKNAYKFLLKMDVQLILMIIYFRIDIELLFLYEIIKSIIAF